MSDVLDMLSVQVGSALQRRNWMLATAESCTGGGVGEAVTRTPGSSAWFDRAFVTYTNEAKLEMLGVSIETLADHGAVSEATAREMAEGALRESNAQVVVAVTGIAGPGGGSASKPVGMVCFAWAALDGRMVTRSSHFSGGRANIRRLAITEAIQGVIDLAEAI